MDELISQQVNNILASARHKEQTNDVTQALESCVSSICQVSGIERNEAKICAYDAAATFRQEEKEVSSGLTILGPTSTGKSQILQKLHDYCYRASDKDGEIISAKYQSFPTVRDDVLEALANGAQTIIVDEADHCLGSRKLEEFIFSSYERSTAKGSIKRAQSDGTWQTERIDIFVPFIESRRSAHLDAANASRATIVETHFLKGVNLPMANAIESPDAEKMTEIKNIELPESITRPSGIASRIWNNWKMRLRIVSALGDAEWIAWAIERMRSDTELLSDGGSYEPQVAMFGSLIASLSKKGSGDYHSVKISSIVDTLRREYGIEKSNMAVSGQLKRLGIEVHVCGGVNRALPSDETIRKGTDTLGLDGEFLSRDEDKRKM